MVIAIAERQGCQICVTKLKSFDVSQSVLEMVYRSHVYYSLVW